MNISKKILRAINEGVLNALSFDDDELPDTLEITMHKVSNNNVNNQLDKLQEKLYYSQKLQEMMPKPKWISNKHIDQVVEFINTALDWHEKYGATYNPHLDKTDFNAFIYCVVTYVPDIANLNWVDTSEVTDMSYLIMNIPDWDGDISEWDVSNVTTMEGMFYSAIFNGNISEWDVSNVENMVSMFEKSGFNGNISNWDVSHLIVAMSMFSNNCAFNLDLSSWDLSHIQNEADIIYMFYGCPIPDEYLPKWKDKQETIKMLKGL